LSTAGGPTGNKNASASAAAQAATAAALDTLYPATGEFTNLVTFSWSTFYFVANLKWARFKSAAE